jgi:hypothetical protein
MRRAVEEVPKAGCLTTVAGKGEDALWLFLVNLSGIDPATRLWPRRRGRPAVCAAPPERWKFIFATTFLSGLFEAWLTTMFADRRLFAFGRL